jgi:hypothetical protein
MAGRDPTEIEQNFSTGSGELTAIRNRKAKVHVLPIACGDPDAVASPVGYAKGSDITDFK